jgi:hypothetical protein
VGANLSDSMLQGARLTGADFTGALLERAKLGGSDLTHADFRGADLKEAQLRGAVLCEALLQGVRMNKTNLAGADMTPARAGCDSESSRNPISRETKSCGVDNNANFFLASFDAVTDLRFADLRGAVAKPLKVPLAACSNDGSQLELEKLPASSRVRLRELGGYYRTERHPASLPPTSVEHLIAGDEPDPTIKVLTAAQVKRPTLQEYTARLVDELRALACESKDPAVNRGLIRRMWRFSQRGDAATDHGYVPCLATAMLACGIPDLQWYESSFLEWQKTAAEPGECEAMADLITHR